MPAFDFARVPAQLLYHPDATIGDLRTFAALAYCETLPHHCPPLTAREVAAALVAPKTPITTHLIRSAATRLVRLMHLGYAKRTVVVQANNPYGHWETTNPDDEA